MSTKTSSNNKNTSPSSSKGKKPDIVVQAVAREDKTPEQLKQEALQDEDIQFEDVPVEQLEAVFTPTRTQKEIPLEEASTPEAQAQCFQDAVLGEGVVKATKENIEMLWTMMKETPFSAPDYPGHAILVEQGKPLSYTKEFPMQVIPIPAGKVVRIWEGLEVGPYEVDMTFIVNQLLSAPIEIATSVEKDGKPAETVSMYEVSFFMQLQLFLRDKDGNPSEDTQVISAKDGWLRHVTFEPRCKFPKKVHRSMLCDSLTYDMLLGLVGQWVYGYHPLLYKYRVDTNLVDNWKGVHPYILGFLCRPSEYQRGLIPVNFKGAELAAYRKHLRNQRIYVMHQMEQVKLVIDQNLAVARRVMDKNSARSRTKDELNEKAADRKQADKDDEEAARKMKANEYNDSDAKAYEDLVKEHNDLLSNDKEPLNSAATDATITTNNEDDYFVKPSNFNNFVEQIARDHPGDAEGFAASLEAALKRAQVIKEKDKEMQKSAKAKQFADAQIRLAEQRKDLIMQLNQKKVEIRKRLETKLRAEVPPEPREAEETDQERERREFAAAAVEKSIKSPDFLEKIDMTARLENPKIVDAIERIDRQIEHNPDLKIAAERTRRDIYLASAAQHDAMKERLKKQHKLDNVFVENDHMYGNVDYFSDEDVDDDGTVVPDRSMNRNEMTLKSIDYGKNLEEKYKDILFDPRIQIDESFLVGYEMDAEDLARKAHADAPYSEFEIEKLKEKLAAQHQQEEKTTADE